MGRFTNALTTLAALSLAACAHSSATNNVRPQVRLDSVPNARVFVMEATGAKRPVIEEGRTVYKVQGFPDYAGEIITTRVLETVRGRHPEAERVDTPFVGQAAMMAVDRGATHLIVPMVNDWRDAATQYSGLPDRVEIELRLLQLRPHAWIASVTFTKRSAVLAIRDERPTRLIDDTFRDAVRKLLGER